MSPAPSSTSPSVGGRNRPELLAVLAASSAATAVFFWRVAFTPDLLLRRDMLRVYLPLKTFWAERVRAGAFPDWYPYDGLGQPYAGMVVSGAFHPSNLLLLLFPAGAALSWSALAAFPVLATGVWLLLRRLGASLPAASLGLVLVSLNGYAVCITSNLAYLMALATVPWALWGAARFFERPRVGRGLLAGALLAAVLLAGDTQSFLVSCVLLLPVALLLPGDRSPGRRAAAWAGLLAMAALVAAPQLVAAAQVMGEARTAGRPLAEALLWSLHPLQLVELVVGPLFGTGELGRDAAFTEVLLHTGMGGLWVESVHFGAVGLVLAATGLATLPDRRLRWTVGGALAAGALLVLGRFGGLYTLVFQLLPLWRPFRYPQKLLPDLFLLLSLLAALGLDRARRDPAVRSRTRIAAMVGTGLLAVLALGEASMHAFTRICQGLADGALGGDGVAALRTNLLQGCGLTAAALAGLVWVLRPSAGPRSAWLLPTGLAMLAFVQGTPLHGAVAPAAVEEVPVTVQAVRALEGPPGLGAPRVQTAVTVRRAIPELAGVAFDDVDTAATTTGLEPVTPALFGLEDASVYLPAASARVAALSRSEGFIERLSGLFGTGYTAVPMDDYLGHGGDPRRVVARSQRLRLLLVANPWLQPRVTLRRPRCVGSPEEALARIADPRFDVRADAAVECDRRAAALGAGAPAEGSVRIMGYLPDRVEIAAAPTSTAVLVLADAYYSGWAASVDGTPAAILPTNLAGRGVLLTAGEHRVVLRYRTPGLRAAMAVSAATLLLGVAVGLIGVVRRVRARRRSPG